VIKVGVKIEMLKAPRAGESLDEEVITLVPHATPEAPR